MVVLPRSVVRIVLACLSAVAMAGAAMAGNVAELPQVRQFIDEMAHKNGFSRDKLVQLFNHVELRPEIIEAMDRPAESLPWYQYRARFVTADRARMGAAFWRAHARVLKKAERVYGVPASVIIAILGIESRYGAQRGRYPVLDSLTTLTLLYPRRSEFFRGELEQFLLLTHEENLDPLTLKGSYAGAIGTPQFIASSYRNYAVDFNGDRRRDLVHSDADVIGSVANYFHVHGWEAGGSIYTDATVSGEIPDDLFEAGVKPSITVSDLKRRGVVLEARVPASDLCALFRLEGRKGELYRVGFQNFYVITRYNRSIHYAMAVSELSDMIQRYYRGRS
jgi:membrane-bound lytic murein transglycosylase B